MVDFDFFGLSILKTTVMMIGEFEYDSIFNDQDPNDPATVVNHKFVTYILFVVFMVIMSIIIMNLLVSLCREVF
jgi:transient receptor potential cation channel subfamily A protein 1